MTKQIVTKLWALLLLSLLSLAPAARAACTYSLSATTRNHGYGANTNDFSVFAGPGCAWTVTNANSWISLLTNASGVSTGLVTYSVAANPNPAWRTGILAVAGQTLTIAQNPVTCNYDITPASRTFGYAGGSGLISLTTSAGCSWAVTNTNPWVTITSGSSGTGNGSIIYSVPANPSSLARNGTITVANQTFAISQLGLTCAYSISTNKQAFGFGATTGQVNVMATPDCNWSVSNTNAWITFLTQPASVGSGAVSYALDVNAGSARTGSVLIADQILTVSQQGLGCNFKLSPTNRPHGYGASSGTIILTTSNGCPWQIINTNSWITFTSGNSGTGSNLISYAIEANPAPSTRVGVVLIDGQTFTLTQGAANCDYSVAPATRNHGYGAASNFISVAVNAGCPWTVENTNAWVTILTSSGAGDADIGYTVPANPNAYSRTGVVVIAGQSFTVSQSPANCSYSIAPVEATHGPNSETGAVSVTAVGGCAWTVQNTNVWISIASPTNGVGHGNVTYTVAANAAGSSRSGNLVIAGFTLAITQAGNSCAYRLSPTTRNHGNGVASNFFTVQAGTNCAWSVVNPNSWLTIVSGASGVSTGAVGYTVASNPTGFSRTGIVTVADQTLTISQSPASCTYSLLPVSASLSAGAATGTVSVTSLAGCPWAVTNSIPWVTILAGSNGVGSGVVTYAVPANPGTNSRSATLTIDGQTFALTQAGLDCSYRLSPTSRAHGFAATTNSINVITADGCPWTLQNTNAWITILSGNTGQSGSTVNYAIDANASGNERVGLLLVDDQAFTITQRVVSCSFTISPANRPHGYGATTNSFAVNVNAACSWTATSTQGWITILSGAAGSGDGTVTYAVAPNLSLSPRSGGVMVDGQMFEITQEAFACSFRLSPASRTHGFSANTGSVNVITTTNCPWVASTAESWITIQPGAGGAVTSFTYTVAGNFTPLQRTGVVLVADQALTLVQRAATNGFAIESITLPEGGGVRLRLAGAPAGAWRVEGSSNLLDWLNLATVTNVTGVVEYFDLGSTSRPLLFYRTVLE